MSECCLSLLGEWCVQKIGSSLSSSGRWWMFVPMERQKEGCTTGVTGAVYHHIWEGCGVKRSSWKKLTPTCFYTGTPKLCIMCCIELQNSCACKPLLSLDSQCVYMHSLVRLQPWFDYATQSENCNYPSIRAGEKIELLAEACHTPVR